MEKLLAKWIRETIKVGLPVQTWVVAIKGKDILHKLYPVSSPDPSEFSDYHFKFGNIGRKGSSRGTVFL